MKILQPLEITNSYFFTTTYKVLKRIETTTKLSRSTIINNLTFKRNDDENLTTDKVTDDYTDENVNAEDSSFDSLTAGILLAVIFFMMLSIFIAYCSLNSRNQNRYERVCE